MGQGNGIQWEKSCEILAKFFDEEQCFDGGNRTGIWPVQTSVTYPEGSVLEYMGKNYEENWLTQVHKKNGH